MNNIVSIEKYHYQGICEIVNKLLNEINYEDGKVDVLQILKKLKIKVIETKLYSKYDVAKLVINPNLINKYNYSKIILLDDCYKLEIKRFSIAFLIGKYIYEYRKKNIFYEATRYITDELSALDRICHKFALELLLPTDKFDEKYDEWMNLYNNEIKTREKLCEYFKVTYSIIEEKIDSKIENRLPVLETKICQYRKKI